MDNETELAYTAFEGNKILVAGLLGVVALKIKQKLNTNPFASILIFSDLTGKQIDLDLHGSDEEIRKRLNIFISTKDEMPLHVGPGRPKIGVIAREISLLPRHWEWLATQSGGASATLRRLVEQARKSSRGGERIRNAQDRTYKFMSVLAGNLPNYEEVLRALYAKDKQRFWALMKEWPSDIRDHSKKLAAPIWET